RDHTTGGSFPQRDLPMASQTHFKQQCPSCEAMVPIKDSSLVGKKVDCPKCKYRFVVEDPGDLDEAPKTDEGPKSSKIRKADKGDKKKKTKPSADGDDKAEAKGKKKPEKKGSSKMLILGIGLGVVAVIALVVGAIVLFGGDGDKKPSGGSTGGNPQANKGSNTPNPSANKDP